MLVGHWPLTEASGDAIDYAGANDGTVAGAAQGVAGPLGYDCYSFDGVDDYINPSGTFFSTSTVTMCAWIKTAGSTATKNIIETYDGSFPQVNLSTRGDSADGAFTRWKNTSGEQILAEGSTNVQDDNWHHLGAVRNGDTATLYVDGTSDATGTNSNVPSDLSAGINIGRRPDGTNHFPGQISDVRLYDHALTPAEVAALADVGSQAAYVSPKQQL